MPVFMDRGVEAVPRRLQLARHGEPQARRCPDRVTLQHLGALVGSGPVEVEEGSGIEDVRATALALLRPAWALKAKPAGRAWRCFMLNGLGRPRCASLAPRPNLGPTGASTARR